MSFLDDKFKPKSDSTALLYKIRTQLFIQDCIELAPLLAQRQAAKKLAAIEANTPEGKLKTAVEAQAEADNLSPVYLKQETKRVLAKLQEDKAERKAIHQAPVDGYEVKKQRKGKAIENATVKRAELTEVFANCFSPEDVVEIAAQIKLAAKRGEQWAIKEFKDFLLLKATGEASDDKPTQAFNFVFTQAPKAQSPSPSTGTTRKDVTTDNVIDVQSFRDQSNPI